MIDEKTIALTEKSASDTIERQIKDTVEKLQKQYEADSIPPIILCYDQ